MQVTILFCTYSYALTPPYMVRNEKVTPPSISKWAHVGMQKYPRGIRMNLKRLEKLRHSGCFMSVGYIT